MPDYTAADPQHAAALLQQALNAGRAGQWLAAAAGLRDSLRADPAQSVAAQGLLECAAQLVRQGRLAPAQAALTAQAEGMISVIVCSIEPERLARLRRDLEREFAAEFWELVHIADARSLNDGYARGLQRARGELIVLCHDDIGILTRHFAARLRAHLARFDLIGAAGSDRLAGPKWFWSGPPHTYSWVSQPHGQGWLAGLLGAYGPVIEGAQALDGVLLAARRAALEQLGFDGGTFDGFHFYDLDLSWRAHCAGLRCAVTLDLLIWHASGGNFAASWQGYAQRFLDKFPALQPRTVQAPYRPGTLLLGDEQLVEPVFDWIGHWLGEAAVR
jgi:Glycosyltransferase like family